jgi:nicotinate-nucleotide pyrophosphorylase (carboxylating)
MRSELPPLDPWLVEPIIARALEEDLAWGDLTTDALIPPELQGHGQIVAKASGVLCGLPVAQAVFHRVDQGVRFQALLPEGSPLEPGMAVAAVEGPLASILKAERTALNFLQRLSGIATETARYVQAVAGTRARIIDTRKTTPGLRVLEKYAVRVGGGANHRYHLGDGVLIKDNHLAALRSQGRTIADALALARARAPHTVRIEVEVTSFAEAQEALAAGADLILLDNMALEEMRRTVEWVAGRALLEASGGVRLETVRAIAETGVDLISVGALTHSVKALDLSLEVVS